MTRSVAELFVGQQLRNLQKGDRGRGSPHGKLRKCTQAGKSPGLWRRALKIATTRRPRPSLDPFKLNGFRRKDAEIDRV